MSNVDQQKLPLWTLTAMVVGGMVGAGVFSIPRNFAVALQFIDEAQAHLIGDDLVVVIYEARTSNVALRHYTDLMIGPRLDFAF